MLLEYCVVAEDGCNWYLLDINIYYSLSEKKQATPRKKKKKYTGYSISTKSRIEKD
jgi:hypothetical protein